MYPVSLVSLHAWILQNKPIYLVNPVDPVNPVKKLISAKKYQKNIDL
jgi:hypothetical protein